MPSLTFQPRVPVFDANVRVGHGHNEPSPAPDQRALLAEMDAQGVGRALIYHALAETMSPIDGNELLNAWLDNTTRLIPQWSALPTADSLAQLKSLYAEGQVQSVRLHSTQACGLPFRAWAYDALLSWLCDARLPLWIPLPDLDADELVTTLKAYPDLAVILVGAHYTHALWVRPLLSALPNAYLELSRYEPIGEIEQLCVEFGAARLLYGSWYPRYAMGPILFYLHHTDISETELALICHANLERILRGDGYHD